MINRITNEGQTESQHPSARLIQEYLNSLNNSFNTFDTLESTLFILGPELLYRLFHKKGLNRNAFGLLGEGILLVEEECIICCELIEDSATRLPCNHFFHRLCIETWFEKNSTCPLCRLDLNRMIVY